MQRDLSLTRVEIKKHEKLGHKKSIDQLRSLVAEMSALSQAAPGQEGQGGGRFGGGLIVGQRARVKGLLVG